MNDLTIKNDGGELVDKQAGEMANPVYIWKLNGVFNISKTQLIVANEYLKSQKYSECIKAVEKQLNRKISPNGIKGILDDKVVKDYITDKWQEIGYFNGWTKERWVQLMTGHINGTDNLSQSQLYGMKLVADVLGYGELTKINQNNIQINITQKDGEE